MGLFGFPRENDFDAAIWAEAHTRGLDPLLVKAIIAQESGFDPNAVRDEPQINDASRGLMQLLLRTATWLGFRGAPADLFTPDVSIQYGTMYLRFNWQRYAGARQLTDTIAAYNAGSVKRTADGTAYVNQGYVDGVLRYYQGYHNAETPPASGGPPVADVLRERALPAPTAPPASGAPLWETVSNWFSAAPAAPAPTSFLVSADETDGVGAPSLDLGGAGGLALAGIGLLALMLVARR